MGTASYHVGSAVQTANGPVMGSTVSASGAQATSGTATNISGVTMAVGEVLQIHADVAMRVSFGGTAATTTTGIYVPAAAQREIICQSPGAVSVIDA